MITVSESLLIERPLAEVFTTIADPFNQLKWDPENLQEVEKLTAGAMGKGTRYRGRFKGFGTVEYEFVEYAPHRHFAHHAVMPFGESRHVFEFEAVAGGTQIKQTIIIDKPKLIARWLAPLMKVMMRKRLHQIATEARHYLVA